MPDHIARFGRWSAALIGAALLVATFSTHAAMAKRVALVIGNSAYANAALLTNPQNDAMDMADALTDIGFDVTLLFDLSADKMRRALASFAGEATGAEYAMVYYAGHGVEVNKENFLVPVDATLESSIMARFEAVPLDLVLEAVDGATDMKRVVLDACRNNPFIANMSDGSRSVGRGLAPLEPSTGTLVAFSAEGGSVAQDGEGRNSPYAASLLSLIRTPGLEVSLLFRQVTDRVLEATNNRQRPFTYGSLPGRELFLVPGEARVATGGQTVVTVQSAPVLPRPDREMWDEVKASDSVAMLKVFVQTYPDSVYAPLASARMAELVQEAADKAARESETRFEVATAPIETTRSTSPVGVTPDAGDFFVVMGSYGLGKGSAAEKRRRELVARGIEAHVINTNDYAGMTPNYLAVVVGGYTRDKANAALGSIRRVVSDAYLREGRRK